METSLEQKVSPVILHPSLKTDIGKGIINIVEGENDNNIDHWEDVDERGISGITEK